MKKIQKIGALVMALTAVVSTGACGSLSGEVEFEIDENKTQIYIAGYNSGTGNEWLDELAKRWNAQNDKYEVIPVEERISMGTMVQMISGGLGTYDCYYMGEVGFKQNIYDGSLEDLSDICAREVDGAGNGTIGDKIGLRDGYFEKVWKPIASKDGEGIYMLPYCDSFGGFLYDHDTFLEMGFMKYATEADATALAAQGVAYETVGNRLKLTEYTGSYEFFNLQAGDDILSAGKDGVYGSYDDGQPQTVAEWEALIAKINSQGMKPFLYAGLSTDYVGMISEAVHAYWAGIEEFETYYDFDGTITIDGVKQTVTPDTGYLVYGSDGFKKGLQFIYDYVWNSANRHSLTNQSLSHTDTQSQYLLGYKFTTDKPAMLVEGTWWENEAYANFLSTTLINDGRGWGQRDYRYMLLPKMDGAYGLDGQGNGSVFSVLNSGAFVVPKAKSDEKSQAKLAALKDFLAYTLTDENLAFFTECTGIINAYDYEIPDNVYQKLTPFSKTVYAMCQDEENIEFVRGQMMYQGAPLSITAGSEFCGYKGLWTHNGIIYGTELHAFRDLKDLGDQTVAAMVQSAKTYYSHNGHTGKTYKTWEQFIEAARKRGYYQD